MEIKQRREKALCKILTKYLIGDKTTSMRKIQLNKTTKQRNEITVRNIIATNKVKGRNSRLDIDKNVRLERKGTFVARNIEVKVNT